MRILHVSDTSIFNYDGISTYINELLNAADSRNDELMVFTTVAQNPVKLRKISHQAIVKVFPNIDWFSSEKFSFAVPLGMRRIMKRFNPDLIWIHTIGPLGLNAAYRGKGKCPIIYVKHCFDGELWCNHLKIRPSIRWFYKWAALFIEKGVLKPSTMALYHFNEVDKIRCNKFFQKFQFHPPPINKRFIEEPSHRNGGNSHITVGFCGRCDPEKGIDKIFSAIDIFHRKYQDKKIKLLLIGEGSVAREQQVIFKDVDVTITGFVDDVIPYLDQLDAFILASTTETTSLSSLEAYSRGLPVFTRRVGYLAFNLYKFENVFCFDHPEELAGLFYEVLIRQKQTVKQVPISMDSSILTFSRLNEIVTAK